MIAVATVIVCSCMQHATAQWTVNGTHIFNSNTGNVGIGTTTPQSGHYPVLEQSNENLHLLVRKQTQKT